MEILENPLEFQRKTLEFRSANIRTVLVPTMGALHAGHLRLLDVARENTGADGRVIATIFVNPIQFNSATDLANYPRTLDRDVDLCREHGVDLIFTPTPESMYPSGFVTRVEVKKMTSVLCGAHRPGHFAGVTTVVMKLFMLAQPSAAVFGWKDAQQFLVLTRMVQDLCIPLQMIGVETVREPDGLALSSRNSYLTPQERAEAPRIFQGLHAARKLFECGEHDTVALLVAARAPIENSLLFKLEYAELRSLNNLNSQTHAEPGNSLLAIAAHLGKARLIDNMRF